MNNVLPLLLLGSIALSGSRGCGCRPCGGWNTCGGSWGSWGSCGGCGPNLWGNCGCQTGWNSCGCGPWGGGGCYRRPHCSCGWWN